MDFDKAIAAHADWKVKLRVALDSKGVLDARTLCSDRHCELGRWLHTEAKHRLGADPNFLQCVDAHREFHEAAGAVATAINAKSFPAAEQQLAPGSRFADASSRVAVMLRRLKRDVVAAA